MDGFTHVAVYKSSSPAKNGEISVAYAFVLGESKNFPKVFRQDEDDRLIRIRKIPDKWREDFRRLKAAWRPRGDLEPYIGFIEYLKNGRIALSRIYHPKDLMNGVFHPQRTAPGLGYYLEALAVNDLAEREGITHVKTSNLPNRLRTGQLNKVGLPLREETPVREWLKGLGRGIRTARNPRVP